MTTATPVSRRFFLTFPEGAGETWVADWSGVAGAGGASGLAGAAGVSCAAGVGSSTGVVGAAGASCTAGVGYSTGVAGAAGRSWVEAAATGADGPAGESSTEDDEAGAGATGSGQDAGSVAATGSGSVLTASSCPVSGRGFKGGTGSSTIFLRSETALATSSGVSSWVFRETG